jgi:hypothetical protein
VAAAGHGLERAPPPRPPAPTRDWQLRRRPRRRYAVDRESPWDLWRPCGVGLRRPRQRQRATSVRHSAAQAELVGRKVGGSSGLGPPIPTSVSTSSGSCRIKQRPLVLAADQQLAFAAKNQQLAFAAKISRSRRASAATHATTCARKADMRNAARCHSSYTHRSGCCPSRPGTCRPGVDRGLFGRLRAPLVPDLKPVCRRRRGGIGPTVPRPAPFVTAGRPRAGRRGQRRRGRSTRWPPQPRRGLAEAPARSRRAGGEPTAAQPRGR